MSHNFSCELANNKTYIITVLVYVKFTHVFKVIKLHAVQIRPVFAGPVIITFVVSSKNWQSVHKSDLVALIYIQQR